MSALEYRILGVALVILGVLLIAVSQLVLHHVRKRMRESAGLNTEQDIDHDSV